MAISILPVSFFVDVFFTHTENILRFVFVIVHLFTAVDTMLYWKSFMFLVIDQVLVMPVMFIGKYVFFSLKGGFS